jgi:hypothetical protein
MELLALSESTTAEGRDGYARAFSRVRPEPWELASAHRVRGGSLSPDPHERSRDRLFFDSMVLRMKIESEAQRLRGVSAVGSRARPDLLHEAGKCLVRSQEMDRRFRSALDESSDASQQRVNELNRSRFRLLRSFSGLWLLHDAAVNV